MLCKYCGFSNGEEDHRCSRCGRRVGMAVAAPLSYSGANALAMKPATASDTESQELFTQMPFVQPPTVKLPPQRPPAPKPSPALSATQDFQPSLFTPSVSNVIPFRPIPQQAVVSSAAENAPKKAPVAAKPAPKPVTQTTMDFTTVTLPKARMLKDSVTSEIFTPRPVAARMLRFVAGMLDMLCILFAAGVFCVTALVLGANFGTGNFFWYTLAGAVALIALLYSVMWSIAGPETFGMRELGLQLINFNGQPLDAKTRLLRTPTSWISICAAGFGLIWCMFDEETLTIHDHISKSFPTERDGTNSIVRQRI